jgi:hypothetical protein
MVVREDAPHLAKNEVRGAFNAEKEYRPSSTVVYPSLD